MLILIFHVEAEGEYARWGSELMKLAVESCKRAMPHIPVIQLTDRWTHGVPGVDEVRRLRPEDDCLMPLKHLHLSQPYLEPWIFLDTDMLVTQSLESVFDEPFDVAIVPRAQTKLISDVPMPEMKYNGGFIACRNHEFFVESHRRIKTYPPELRQWFGDQIALDEASKTGRWKVKDLGDEWNHAVTSPEDFNAKVLHYKGPKRKDWMPAAAVKLRETKMSYSMSK